MTLEVVTWRDAHFDTDERPKGTRGDYLVRTVGWTKDGPRFLRIVGEKTPDGKRGVTYVPNESIVERRVVK